MSDAHKLTQLMRDAGKTPQNEIVDIVVGVVTSVSPLKVKVENRELTQSFLIVGALCKETHIGSNNIVKNNHHHTISEKRTESSGEDLHYHVISQHNTNSEVYSDDYDIILWRGLRINDKVLMLKVGRGQKYYIIQREEGVTSS